MKIIKLIFLNILAFTAIAEDIPLIYKNECMIRNGLPNFFEKAVKGGQVKVAFLGGSITAQPGYRVQTLDWLRHTWPETDFVGINAAIGGTGSELGAFRVASHVLEHNPDIVFVEFCVNDTRQAKVAPEKVLNAMEGIVRQIIAHNSKTDICFIYTITDAMIEQLKANKCPESFRLHEKVADFYGIPSINMGFPIFELVRAGRLIMKGSDARTEIVSVDFVEGEISMPVNQDGRIIFSNDGVHPYLNSGHVIYFQAVKRSFIKMIPFGKPYLRTLSKPLDTNNLEKAKMLSLSDVNLRGQWTEYNWSTQMLSLSLRAFMLKINYTCNQGSSVEFIFKGRAFGAFDIMGPGAGQLVCNVDGEDVSVLSRFDQYCSYYRINYFINHLEEGIHTVKIGLADTLCVENKQEILKQRGVEMTDSSAYENNCWYLGNILLIGDLEIQH